MISSLPSLQYFSLSRQVVVSADASSDRICAVLLQRDGERMLPLTFASRTLTDAVQRYAQIEKECLAAVWSYDNFGKYLVSLSKFELCTEHKKPLDRAPIRCQRVLFRLLKFALVISHKPGKQIVIADALSQNPRGVSNSQYADEVELYVDNLMAQMLGTERRLSKLRRAMIHGSDMGELH